MSHKVGILVAVYVAVLAINLDITIVNVALPDIATELGANTKGLQWIVDGYNLAFAALVLAAGSLSDRHGRRPALILGLLGFAAASAVGGLVHGTPIPSPTGDDGPPPWAVGVPWWASGSRPDRSPAACC
ncbi:MFS transporter [Tsukamurella soli]|uniref:Major facilitator superfamily (MFS) profile domain-containing protein n=1 Tax=Tsukamurella soli TaxID=644556 RepID=A0ABP8JQC0_9ACTN